MTMLDIGKFSKLAAAGVLAVGFGAMSASAATFVDCATLVPDATGKLTPSDACAASDSNQPPQGSQLDGLFGLDNWKQIGKIEAGDVDGTSGGDGWTFTSEDGNFTGTWSISQAILNKYVALAWILNDGNQAPAPTIAYRVSTSPGTWETPWVTGGQGPNAGSPNNSLSNVQLVGVIPLPATGWLLLSVLGAGGFVAHRRRKQKAA
jgi:hypothetical protein